MDRITHEILDAMECAIAGVRFGGEFISARVYETAILIAVLDPSPFLAGEQIAMVLRRDAGSRILQEVNVNCKPDLYRPGRAAREAVLGFLSSHRFALIYPKDCFLPVWQREVPLLA